MNQSVVSILAGHPSRSMYLGVAIIAIQESIARSLKVALARKLVSTIRCQMPGHTRTRHISEHKHLSHCQRANMLRPLMCPLPQHAPLIAILRCSRLQHQRPDCQHRSAVRTTAPKCRQSGTRCNGQVQPCIHRRAQKRRPLIANFVAWPDRALETSLNIVQALCMYMENLRMQLEPRCLQRAAPRWPAGAHCMPGGLRALTDSYFWCDQPYSTPEP